MCYLQYWKKVISNDSFYKNYRECKQSNIERSLRRYYENKDILSNQSKKNMKKNVLLANSKVNQQSRKSHWQQIKDLNNKVEELT